MATITQDTAFTGGPEQHTFPAILFDNGTLVDSTPAIEKHWHKIGKELGIDPNVVLQSSHGRRSIDTLKLYDPSKANWEYVSAIEGAIPYQFGADARLVEGAQSVLASLDAMDAPWAIVTSGTRALLEGWLDVMRLDRPKTLIVAEDCEAGKPDPQPYLLAKKRLGLSAETVACVVEDSTSGVLSGKKANCKVIAVLTSHSAEQLRQAGADWIVADLRSITVTSSHDAEAKVGGVTITLSDTLQDLSK